MEYLRLEQLRFVVDVADSRSIRMAADELYVTPQNISKSIHQLEEELQTIIFNRTKYGMFLTADGQLVYDTAQDILQRVSFLQNAFLTIDAAAEQAEIKGILKIISDASLNLSTYRLQRIMLKRYPAIKLTSSEYEASYINKLLENHGNHPVQRFPYDMVFTSSFQNHLHFSQALHEQFDIYFLKNEHSGVLMNQDDALAGRASISLKDLANLPIAAFSVNDEPPMIIQALESYGVKLQVAFLSNSYYNWDKYIQDGIAYGLVGSDYMVNHSPDKVKTMRTVFVPLKEKLLSSHFLLTRKREQMTPGERIFLEIVRDHYYQTIQSLNEYDRK